MTITNGDETYPEPILDWADIKSAVQERRGAGLDADDIARLHGVGVLKDLSDRAWTVPDRPAGARGKCHKAPFRFRLTPFDALTAASVSKYVVKGIIPRTGLVLIWGPPKCGKSFWILDLSLHIAIGRKYRSHRVKQGIVVYRKAAYQNIVVGIMTDTESGAFASARVDFRPT